MDSTAFPHILDNIIAFAAADYAYSRNPSFSVPKAVTTLSLRGTSRAVRDKFDQRLFIHIAWYGRDRKGEFGTPMRRGLPCASSWSWKNLPHAQPAREYLELAHHTRVIDFYDHFRENHQESDPSFSNLKMARYPEVFVPFWSPPSVPIALMSRHLDEPTLPQDVEAMTITALEGVRRWVVNLLPCRSFNGNGLRLLSFPKSVEDVIIVFSWAPWRRRNPDGTQPEVVDVASASGYFGTGSSSPSTLTDTHPVFNLFVGQLVTIVQQGGRVTFVHIPFDPVPLSAPTRDATLRILRDGLDEGVTSNVRILSWEEWAPSASPLETDWFNPLPL